MTTQSKAEITVTKDMDIKDVHQKSVLVLDADRIKSNKACINFDSFHKDTKTKFMDILNKQFKQVPSHPDLFFFCPPGLDIGGLHNNSSRKRNETRSSEGTSKNFHSGSSGKIKVEDDEERTIEFRSEVSEGSVKKVESMTDVETNVREENMSVMSNLETVDMDDDEDEEEHEETDDFSPPLFIQFSLAISQDKEDIVCAPVKHLPTCLSEIFQDDSIPDAEQELDIESLGLRLDLVCMTLPKALESLTENFACLRSTSLCSSTSYRDSNSLTDDEQYEIGSIEEDLNSGSDVLAHLPEFQHHAVDSVLEEMKWMLRDEIAFALTKTMPLSQQTLEFVRNHVQSSVNKSGSYVETVDLNFVFGTQVSLDKFKENFLNMEVHGFILKEEGDFYYIDVLDGVDHDDFCNRGDNQSGCRRKVNRQSRLQQLSPVKEASTPVQADNESHLSMDESLGETLESQSEDSVEFIEINPLEENICKFTERSSIISNLSCIFQVDRERVNMFLHFRDSNPHVKSIWKTVHQELLTAIKNICIQVNQSLLLNDLYDRRMCNRLLEQESTDDIFRDPSRLSNDTDEDDSPYLEANLNMKFTPGQFKCPEVWETKFYLHPRLKQGQGHGSYSRGLQAMKNILSCYMVTNRSNMFVYKDDKKNIFYMKMAESIQSNFTVSRQSSLLPPSEDHVWSRSSSISSSKTLKKDSVEESVTYSRSNSVGEADKKTEDFIILKVFGITEASQNIKQDLVAVLQKKLDDKVVEVISTMIQRNARCKLSSDDVLFLQKPRSPPDKVLQYTVNINTIHYLQAVAYYLRQNLVQIPLIAPNYMAGCKKFKDFNMDLDQKESGQIENDVFLYNEFNQSVHQELLASKKSFIPRGDHKGIACIALSIVDGGGNLVKHFSYPKPAPNDCDYDLESFMRSLEEMIQTDVFAVTAEGSPKPGPIALIQFRIWESGRIDFEKLTGLLHVSIRQAMWDAILEYKMLSAPLSFRDPSKDIQEAMLDTEEEENRIAMDVMNPFLDTIIPMKQPGDKKNDPSVPEIVIEANELVEKTKHHVLDAFEEGIEGFLHVMYSSVVFKWLELGIDLDSPSVSKHSVDLVAANSLQYVLKELQAQILTIIPDLRSKVFQKMENDGKEVYLPYKKNTEAKSEEFIFVSRNFDHWSMGTKDDFVDPLLMKTRTVKMSQNFPPLILAPESSETDQLSSLSPPVATMTPVTPTTPAFNSSVSGMSGMIQTIQTTCQVFVPRQRLIIAKVSSKNITFYLYNLSKDCQERLKKQTSNLGQWFTARTSLMGSIVAQKLGLFHNQHFFRPENKTNNPFVGNEAFAELLVKNHAPPLQQLKEVKATTSTFKDVYKNPTPFIPLQKMKFSEDTDTLGKHGRQMVNIANSVQREYHSRLFFLWQSRGENCNSIYDENLITYFKTKARLLHYVFTPMLFLPKWRWQANATRDHAAAEFPFEETKRNSGAHLLDQAASGRNRHGSGISVKVTEKKTGSGNSPVVNKSPTGSPKPMRVNQNERFHSDLLSHFFQEYIQYLQTLGFILIDLKQNTSKKSRSIAPQDDTNVVRRRHTTGKAKTESKTKFLQKSLLGGILIFEIGICEPFFYTKLHAMEASRIQLKSNQQFTGKTFVSSFIDECDRIKVLIHLHSFTYDYHLRTIQSHIAQKHTNLRSGFHVVSFLEDFMKYYSKGPNFARNLVQNGSIEIATKSVSPVQLFNFLLSHEKQYGMSVIRMEPVIIDPNTEMDNEYVLIKISQNRVTFKDHQDARRTDDFDVSLVISYDSCGIGKSEKQKADKKHSKFWFLHFVYLFRIC